MCSGPVRSRTTNTIPLSPWASEKSKLQVTKQLVVLGFEPSLHRNKPPVPPSFDAFMQNEPLAGFLIVLVVRREKLF